MRVRLILDSTADLTAQVRNQCQIIPLTVRFGDEEYLDGVTINHETFYQKLSGCQNLPTTSQPTPDSFIQAFQSVVDAGDAAVVLTISSKLSGTYQSASIAAMDFPGRIFVVDSRTVTIGIGVLAELALSLINEGLSAEAVADKLTEARDNVRLIAMLDTLEYLKKGGRISKTAAFAGELLSIKPIIGITDGEIKVLCKARGERQVGSMLMGQIESAGGIDFSKPILPGYTGLQDAPVKKFLADQHGGWDVSAMQERVTIIGSVIGTHAGPNAFAVAFFTK